ncbi:hypothetical protein L2E82_27177 [Cichorium intybus]|uniref:Uncharacterized protein n=1 Tax=Cichorium intybus TaxID=13427 RepID=A0ACB9CS93_CICIN|nr:hypothetical protein L2E82_27177 [Cichorium intybus]
MPLFFSGSVFALMHSLTSLLFSSILPEKKIDKIGIINGSCCKTGKRPSYYHSNARKSLSGFPRLRNPPSPF